MPSAKSRKSIAVIPSQPHPQTISGLAPLLTPDQVSVLLGIPRLTVIRQSKAGKIPALKLGRCYRYRSSTIDSWLREQEQA